MFSDHFIINKNFQSSVNLELDLNSKSKIEEYIPTTDICDVLKRYIKSVLGLSKEKATTLIGPYGKGKSFLLLVLTFILSKNKDTKEWNNLASKIKSVDEELFNLLISIKEKNICLLPILINSNFDNVTQSFQIALNEALRREGLDEIIPQSAFDVCISLLDKWTSKEAVKSEILNKCLEITGLNSKKLRAGLENYSPTAYRHFVDLYNCVNIGLEFNPLINNDIVKTYSDISLQLSKYGFSGMFVIFDEFSKFIESNSSSLMKDLKIVQDMAELCARSNKNSQIHLCCVAHKSLVLYEYSKTTSADSFKTVEGRFKEVRFNRSIEENYQIIASAIKKDEEAYSIIHKYLSKNEQFYNQIKDTSLFNDRNLETTLFKECFPLNPLTAYSLIQISEYAAQNERTLFTFLSDTDDDSFNSFLHSNDDKLFCVDKIYDYFSPLLQKEETNLIRNIWYRTESILGKLENIDERKIIKALSVILMINDFEKLPPNENTLSLALQININSISAIISSLIEKHYLRRNILNNLLSFALSNTKEIDENLELLEKTKFKNIRYADFADQINENKFVLPRKYNEENKITRFFKTQFISEEDFLNIKSFNYYFDNNTCDGLIVYILKNNINKTAIIKKANEIYDKRVVYKFPKEKVDEVFYKSVLRFACLNEAKKQKGLDEITINEINLLLQETIDDVRTLIEKYYVDSCDYYSILMDREIPFGLLTSNIMNEIFPVKLIFNNELINKNCVSSQYQKAINHVIDWLIDGKDSFNFSQTSPEMSIKASILDYNLSDSVNQTSARNFREIIEKIKTKITESSGEKIIIKSITDEFLKEPYGIRTGVIPVLLAVAISELSDNIIIYFANKEIELNSVDLVKAVSNEKYSISSSKGSAEQKAYLKRMLKLFNVETTNNFRKDTFNLSISIKRVFVGLPQIIRLCTSASNFINLEEAFIKYKNLFLSFNVNPYEVIYDEPKKIFNTRKYDDLSKEIERFIKNKDVLLIPFKQKLIDQIKDIFNISNDSSLKSGFIDFAKANVKEGQKPLLESTNKNIYNLVTMEFSYNDMEALDLLSKVCVGNYIEDWDLDKTNRLIDSVLDFKNEVINSSKVSADRDGISLLLNSNKDLSQMATLLKNNIESVLEEFSGGVTSEDKVAVLAKLLKDLL